MEPTEFYRSLIASIDDAAVKRVASILADHVGEKNSITLEQICLKCYGSHNSTTERQVREILETLVTAYHLPVGAHSGKSGRWLCETEEEREQVAAELDHRAGEIQKRARNLRTAKVPPKMPTFERAKQASFWGD